MYKKSWIIFKRQGQGLKLFFDTGSSDLWFASSLCLFCGSHTKYNPLKSSTSSVGVGPWSVRYGDGSTAGGVMSKEPVDIGGIIVKEQTIQIATHESSSFQKGVADGLLGLGFNHLASVRGTITPVDNIIRQHLIKKPIFSVYLGKHSIGGGGGYIFGGSNPAHYQEPLMFVPANSSKGYWNVQVTSISTGNVLSNTTKQSYGQFETIVDTGTTLVLLPMTIADMVASLYHAKINNDGTYSISRDSSKFEPLLSLHGGSWFQIPGDDLVYAKGEKGCVAGFIAGNFSFAILGDVFIRNNYVISPINY
ncbi:aspartic peptidase domain-containing protein [Chlamydoabsidia padenii]|nr:aspartic peptidase domain-containing protein [Chlamydoabsidia padenii]